MKVDPWPGSLWTSIRPPCASTSWRAMYSPSPRPPYLRTGTARARRLNEACGTLRRQRGKIELLGGELDPARFDAGNVQQGIDQLDQAAELLGDARRPFPKAFVLRALDHALQSLDGQEHGGEWGAQLVRCHGEEFIAHRDRLSCGLIETGVLQGALLDGGARRLLAKEVLVLSLGLVPVDRQLDGDVQLALVERFEQISERLGHPRPAQRRLVGERGQVDHWQRELGT